MELSWSIPGGGLLWAGAWLREHFFLVFLAGGGEGGGLRAVGDQTKTELTTQKSTDVH